MSDAKMVSGFVTGKVTEVGGMETIGGKYDKRQIVVEYTDGNFTGSLALEFFGRNAPKADGISVGDRVTVHYNSKSRKSGARWFNTHDAWRVERAGGEQRRSEPQRRAPAPPPYIPPNDDSDIPF